MDVEPKPPAREGKSKWQYIPYGHVHVHVRHLPAMHASGSQCAQVGRCLTDLSNIVPVSNGHTDTDVCV